MKKKIVNIGLVLGIVCTLLAGCTQEGISDTAGEGNTAESNVETAQNDEEEVSHIEEDGNAQNESEDLGDSTEISAKNPLEGGIPFTWHEISLTFPANWKDRYVIREHEIGNGFSVLQKASDDKEAGWGFLFSVYSEDAPYIDMPGVSPIAYTVDKMYYIGMPTDVPYDYEDEAIAKDYADMQEDLEIVKASIAIAGKDVFANASEYVYPMSEYYPLTEDMLLNMGDRDLWLARNEIYARHGYHFKNVYLQAYFEKYDWYEDRGTAFSENEFSQIEKDNITLLKEMEDRLTSENQYPMEKKVGEKVSVDLSGNGKNNALLYQVQSDDTGASQAYLTVDGKKYSLEDDFDIYMAYPEEEHFYITDISPFFDGLEIAIADYGPSDDPVTHFFIYDENDGLMTIGSVSGFPMKQMGPQNGFSEGGVTGYGRCMTLDVHEYWEYYWYNYEERRLELQEGGESHSDMPRTHRLLMDLPLHYSMDQDSPTFIIPEGSKTFFKECIGKEWILVHGPNGAEGYLHYGDVVNSFPVLDELDVDADEVFDGLLIYD